MGKTKKTRSWQEIAGGQESVISFRQLRKICVTRAAIRHHVKVGRWAQRSSEVTATRIVVQCSAYEIRHEPWEVMEDLIALGVPRVSTAS